MLPRRALAADHFELNDCKAIPVTQHQLLYVLGGQPGSPVFADERDAFIDRVHTMWNGKIDVAGEFVTFAKHRTTSPRNKLGPHFPHHNKGRVIKFADLKELPRERHLQQRSDTARDHYESVGHDHEMM